jgi:hypothetical protein
MVIVVPYIFIISSMIARGLPFFSLCGDGLNKTVVFDAFADAD